MGSFQDLLNRLRGNDIPSQMPGAMGGGFDHGITGNMSDIQQMPYRYGDQGQLHVEKPTSVAQLPFLQQEGTVCFCEVVKSVHCDLADVVKQFWKSIMQLSSTTCFPGQ